MMLKVGGWDQNDTSMLNRELSWLAFNARVLEFAADDDTPLLEQAEFCAIFARNLDEFFQVRVSGLHDQLAAGITSLTPDGRSPRQQLEEIRVVVGDLCARHEQILMKNVMPALRDAGVALLEWDDLGQRERADIADRFQRRIFPVLTPLAVDPGHPFPYISDLSLNLAVLVQDPIDCDQRFARVKVPNTLGRWIPLADDGRFVSLESVIAAHLSELFTGMEIVESHLFRVTRNADLTLDDSEADDLLVAVEMELRRRRFGRASRLEVAASMSDEVLELLTRELDLEESDVYQSAAPLDATSLFAIASLDRPELKWPKWHGVIEPEFEGVDGPADMFKVLRTTDVLLHHPYSSFTSSVVEFIHQAAVDPDVLAIKLTLYRTSGDSPIVDALIRASERGKQVAVLVELEARFDEAANIGWARRLEQAGVHVAYGLPGLKIHAKIAMVVREEADGIRRYCHLGTGNYNPRTARTYEDLGILTADPAIGEDLADLFNALTGYSHALELGRLIVAPEMLRHRFYDLIDQEIEAGQGRMILKLNGLADEKMIEKLYEASQAGVDIDIIVRGICGLRPGRPGMSENIRVRSIVGRFLEHSRIFLFANGAGPGEPRIYVGSPDLMGRNLDRRVETLMPIDSPPLAARLRETLEVLLADDRLAWTLDGSGVWTRRRGHIGTDSQIRLQQLARARADA